MSVESKKGEPQSVIIAAGVTCDSSFHGSTLWGVTFPDIMAHLVPSSLIERVRARVASQGEKVHKRTGCTHGISVQFESREHDEARTKIIIPREEI